MIDVKSAKCLHCDKYAFFALPDRKREYCSEHIIIQSNKRMKL